jgi:Fic family protein
MSILSTIEAYKALNIHQVIVSKAEFRKGNVQAGNTYFVNYDKVIPYTASLAERLQTQMKGRLTIKQQIELSFSAHFDLVAIHPFYDGNGRTSRLLMNFIQQYYGLPLAIVFAEDKADYYNALEESRKNQNATIFYDFMITQYQKHLDKEISGYEKMIRGENLTPNQGKGSSMFF